MRTVALLTSAWAACSQPSSPCPPSRPRRPAAPGPPRARDGPRASTRARPPRARAGASEPRLARAADYHSWEMLDANYFAHASRDGGSFDGASAATRTSTRSARRWRCSAAAAAAAAPRRIVADVDELPGHRAILLSGASAGSASARAPALGGTQACVVTADFGSQRVADLGCRAAGGRSGSVSLRLRPKSARLCAGLASLSRS